MPDKPDKPDKKSIATKAAFFVALFEQTPTADPIELAKKVNAIYDVLEADTLPD